METSCDDTAAAVVRNGREILSSVVASQIDRHKVFGGVVPEEASRMHIEAVDEVAGAALAHAGLTAEMVDAVAVTAAPGLIGALLVGVNFAKGLAFACGKPLIAVHHLKGHIAANYIACAQLEPPFLCLVASGGHTLLAAVEDYTKMRTLGATCDDAAGECLDKVARVMGFAYPGGVNLDRFCGALEPKGIYKFPKPKPEGLDFSFSGLKTAAVNLLHKEGSENIDKAAFARDFLESVTEQLCERAERAIEKTGYKKFAIAGGVSANSVLREKARLLCGRLRAELFLPPLPLCGDNAAMIASAAYFEYIEGNFAPLSLNARACAEIDE